MYDLTDKHTSADENPNGNGHVTAGDFTPWYASARHQFAAALTSFVIWMKSFVWPPRRLFKSIALLLVAMFITDVLKSGLVADIMSGETSVNTYDLAKLHSFCIAFESDEHCLELRAKWNKTYVAPQEKFNQQQEQFNQQILKDLNFLQIEMAKTSVEFQQSTKELREAYASMLAAQSAGDFQEMLRNEERLTEAEAKLESIQEQLLAIDAAIKATGRKIDQDTPPDSGNTAARRPELLSEYPHTRAVQSSSEETAAIANPVHQTRRSEVRATDETGYQTITEGAPLTGLKKGPRVTNHIDRMLNEATASSARVSVNQKHNLERISGPVPSEVKTGQVTISRAEPIIIARDPRKVAEFQLRARALGYYPGPIDGLFGPKSGAALSALKSLDRALDLPNLSEVHLAYLRVKTSELEQTVVEASLNEALKPRQVARAETTRASEFSVSAVEVPTALGISNSYVSTANLAPQNMIFSPIMNTDIQSSLGGAIQTNSVAPLAFGGTSDYQIGSLGALGVAPLVNSRADSISIRNPSAPSAISIDALD